jgi:hypothetical protein
MDTGMVFSDSFDVRLKIGQERRIILISDVIKGKARPGVLILYRTLAVTGGAARSRTRVAGHQGTYFAAASGHRSQRSIRCVFDLQQLGSVDRRGAVIQRDCDLVLYLHSFNAFPFDSFIFHHLYKGGGLILCATVPSSRMKWRSSSISV